MRYIELCAASARLRWLSAARQKTCRIHVLKTALTDSRGAKDLKLDLFETGRKRPKTTGMSRAGVQNVVGLLYGVSGGHLGDRCFETCCAPRKMRAQQANAAKMRQKCVLCFTFTTFTCPQPHNTAPQPACPELGANASTLQVSHEGRTARTRRQHCPKPPQSLSFSHMMT